MNIDVQGEKNELEEFKDLTGKVTVAMTDVLASLYQKNIEYLGIIEQLQRDYARLKQEKKQYEDEIATKLQNSMETLSNYQKEQFEEMAGRLQERMTEQKEQLDTMQNKQIEDYNSHCMEMKNAWQDNVQPLKTLHSWLFEQKKKLISDIEDLNEKQKVYDDNVMKLDRAQAQLNKERKEFESEKESQPNIEILTGQLEAAQKEYEKLFGEKSRLEQQYKDKKADYESLEKEMNELKGSRDDYKEKYETINKEAEKHLLNLNKYELKYGPLEEIKGADNYGE